MDKEQKQQLEDELTFASMGKQVISNHAYQSAITARKAQIFDVFCRTSADQTDIREEAWRTMKNMDALEDYLNTILTTGKMAQATLDIHNPDK